MSTTVGGDRCVRRVAAAGRLPATVPECATPAGRSRLVVPGKEGDYFSGEQVLTWGIDQFWGLPEYPHTPHYRTAIATLDLCEPAAGTPIDQYQHWGLIHFLLDGHHELEAAATVDRPVRILSLSALGEGVAGAEDGSRREPLGACSPGRDSGSG
ncbi:hypothetical protein [Streptomyces flavofungini]|uniref:hypothetical protein n=1 Tax=Streptomyces flavofungini TaxID=68200 RepID=UPI0034DE339B